MNRLKLAFELGDQVEQRRDEDFRFALEGGGSDWWRMDVGGATIANVVSASPGDRVSGGAR